MGASLSALAEGDLVRVENPSEKHCGSEPKIAEQFATCARLYAEAVIALAVNYTAKSCEEYRRLWNAAEEARQRSESMREAFRVHVESHRCGPERLNE